MALPAILSKVLAYYPISDKDFDRLKANSSSMHGILS